MLIFSWIFIIVLGGLLLFTVIKELLQTPLDEILEAIIPVLVILAIIVGISCIVYLTTYYAKR